MSRKRGGYAFRQKHRTDSQRNNALRQRNPAEIEAWHQAAHERCRKAETRAWQQAVRELCGREESMNYRQTANSAGANLVAVLSVIAALGALYVPLLFG